MVESAAAKSTADGCSTLCCVCGQAPDVEANEAVPTQKTKISRRLRPRLFLRMRGSPVTVRDLVHSVAAFAGEVSASCADGGVKRPSFAGRAGHPVALRELCDRQEERHWEWPASAMTLGRRMTATPPGHGFWGGNVTQHDHWKPSITKCWPVMKQACTWRGKATSWATSARRAGDRGTMPWWALRPARPGQAVAGSISITPGQMVALIAILGPSWRRA